MRIGIFGGSFDPIHLGHLLLAEQCLEAAGLDQIRFIPASVPPHKQDQLRTGSDLRLEMLRLAISGHSRFELDTCELDRGGVSYTVDTLQEINDRSPEDSLFLLIGGDSLDEFHTWKDPDIICEMAIPIIVGRPGSSTVDLSKLAKYASPQRMNEIEQVSFDARQIELSSSEIRGRVFEQKSIRYMTTRSVEQLILEKELYRDSRW